MFAFECWLDSLDKTQRKVKPQPRQIEHCSRLNFLLYMLWMNLFQYDNDLIWLHPHSFKNLLCFWHFHMIYWILYYLWYLSCSVFLNSTQKTQGALSSPHSGLGRMHRWGHHSHLLLPFPPYPWLIVCGSVQPKLIPEAHFTSHVLRVLVSLPLVKVFLISILGFHWLYSDLSCCMLSCML